MGLFKKKEEEPEKKREVKLVNFITPRLFVIESNGTGYELLTASQIENYKMIKEKDVAHVKYLTDMAFPEFTSHYWVTKHYSINDGIIESHHINEIKIPIKLEKFVKIPKEPEFELKDIYLYRNLIETKPFDDEFREKIKDSKEKCNQYFEKKATEWFFGTYMNKEAFSQINVPKEIIFFKNDNLSPTRVVVSRYQSYFLTMNCKLNTDKIISKLKNNQNNIICENVTPIIK